MSENLEQLREIAQNATPGPWEVHDRGIGYEVRVNGHELNHCSRETFNKWDATHIATFDPPTVLALIDRVEAAEAAVQRVESLAGEWVRSGNGHWRDLHRALDGGEQK